MFVQDYLYAVLYRHMNLRYLSHFSVSSNYAQRSANMARSRPLAGSLLMSRMFPFPIIFPDDR